MLPKYYCYQCGDELEVSNIGTLCLFCMRSVPAQNSLKYRRVRAIERQHEQDWLRALPCNEKVTH